MFSFFCFVFLSFSFQLYFSQCIYFLLSAPARWRLSQCAITRCYLTRRYDARRGRAFGASGVSKYCIDIMNHPLTYSYHFVLFFRCFLIRDARGSGKLQSCSTFDCSLTHFYLYIAPCVWMCVYVYMCVHVCACVVCM